MRALRDFELWGRLCHGGQFARQSYRCFSRSIQAFVIYAHYMLP